MRTKIKLRTINVIEYCNDTIDSVYSFSDDKKGNERAEKVFARVLQRVNKNIDDEDIQDALDDGFFENNDGTWKLFLTHSSR